MRLMNRGMGDIIIVDNCPTAYMLSPEVALPIKTWEAHHENDRELEKLIPLLELLSKVDNCQRALSEFIDKENVDLDEGMLVC